MSNQAPSARTYAALIVFVAGCFGLLLYLWLAFGGTIPLQPQGYRMRVAFPDASSLVRGADVRIAGVDVGKVNSTRADIGANRTVAELELSDQFAPRPVDTRAILRQKTMLGEVYIELTPGSASAPKLQDGGMLAAGRVAPTVRFDEFLRTFDPPTRRALTRWLTAQGAALRDGGPALSAFLAQLYPFATSAGDVLEVVHEQDRATASLIRDGGVAMGALARRRGELRRLLVNSAGAFGAMAASREQLAQALRIMPTFLMETRATVRRVAAFSETATPLVNQLRPAARELAPALADLREVAPSLRRLMTGLAPLAAAAQTGEPALERMLGDTAPLLGRAKPYLGGLVPIITYADRYRREIAGFAANVAAATQATLPAAGGGRSLHYARASLPINPEALAPLTNRSATSRTDPYPMPGAGAELARGFAQFGGAPCVTRPPPALSSAIPPDLRKTIADSYFTDDPRQPAEPGPVTAPCRDSGLLGPALDAGPGAFPHLRPLP